MADEDLRELERRWAEGQGDLAAGEAFSRALERAGAEVGRRLEVRLQVLRAHMSAAGLGHRPLGPQPELDPMAASFLIPGEDAFKAWHALRSRIEASGAYPVIVGSEQQFERRLEAIASAPELLPEGVLEAARDLDFCAIPSPVEWEDRWWPADAAPEAEFAILQDHWTGEPRIVRVVLLSTVVPWHAAAFLRFGLGSTLYRDGTFAVNRRPHESVAWHRSWYERFGAEPFGAVLDSVELWVARPPRTREDSVQLAAEHERYCEPLRGLGSVEQRGARLLGGSAWRFDW